MPNLDLSGGIGKTAQLYDLKNQKAIVVALISFDCPVSKRYCPLLADMMREFSKQGVSFIGLNVDHDETPARIAAKAKEFNLAFPVYHDSKHAIAKALKVENTPEVFLIDNEYVLRYRGRIDDSYADTLKKRPLVTKHDLRDTLRELLEGRALRPYRTRVVGSPVPREVRVAKNGDVTFYRDVLPILQNSCQACHRPGAIGGFSLTTFEQAVVWAERIKKSTQSRLMPPWMPGEKSGLRNERTLTKKQIDILAAWADKGTPKGDPKDAPAVKHFPFEWQLGKPDLILSADENFTLGPTGNDVFRSFILSTKFDKEQYVTGIEVRPSNAGIVNSVVLYLDTRGQGRMLERSARASKHMVDSDQVMAALSHDHGPGFTVEKSVSAAPDGILTAWVPGQEPVHLPDNSAYLLPSKSDVIMQIRYQRSGRVEKDRTQIGLFFAKGEVDKVYQGGVLAGAQGTSLFRFIFSIPAGAESFTVHGHAWAQEDFVLYSLLPDMRLLGNKIKVTMTPPASKPQTLLTVNQWDYNWQETYLFKEPIPVKVGTHFQVEAVYNNSVKNPYNPFHPPRRSMFGEERCFVFLGGVSARQTSGAFWRGLRLRPVDPNTNKEARQTDRSHRVIIMGPVPK